MLRPLILFFAVLAACTTERNSDGTSGEERDAYAAALAANWGLDGSSGFVLIGQRATCVAEGWLDVLGVQRLRDAGVEPADVDPRRGGAFRPLDLDISEEEATAMVDAFSACDADLVDLFVSARAAELDDQARACLRDELSAELARAVVESSLRFESPPGEVLDGLSELNTVCNTG